MNWISIRPRRLIVEEKQEVLKRILILSILVLAIIFPSLAAAEVFVDWQAGFHITLPDDWQQVPYSTVSAYLRVLEINPITLNFDGALSQKSDKPFFMAPHMFIAHYPVGQLNQRQIDSVLDEMAAASESGKYVEGSLTAPKVQFYEKQPMYDPELKVVAVATFVKAPGADQISLEIRKFYEKGVAVFIAYGPRENYNSIQPIFLNIIKSFSTKDLDKAAPKESLKVVDISQRQLPTAADTESSIDENGGAKGSNTLIYIISAAALLVGVIWLIARKKKPSSGSL